MVRHFLVFIYFQLEGKCFTSVGTDGYTLLKKPCVFPFTFQNHTVNKCVQIENYKGFVCPIANPNGNWYWNEDWGRCGVSCETMKGISARKLQCSMYRR